ncbi:plasmid replication protein RepC [Pararhizobium sp. BT-229]|uniref:plasmid replication protein RepC n=1 Tax=Pararhizobium sp. BT-229 TaxID=2986923 RepID=UPI0021F7DED8|nr:plasmid replication protein RepC [Pararhizobium sp. BT-229]MCV9967209.1 plasmid replication protein RepC [Pararhizobium sp. BT-229]
MEGGSVATPFGRRAMTLGMLANQVMAQEIEDGKTVDKWKLYRALCEARPLIGVTDRALAVMNALLSFYPKDDLSEAQGLVVFPSNAQLSLRSHGMTEQTIRRHLAVLVEAGLIVRKDSPNGKRYVRRNDAGSIDEAFGFSLAPLLARANEIQHLAAQVTSERLHLQRLRERLTLCRRDIAKLIEAAVEEGAKGDWEMINLHFRALVTAIPRAPVQDVLAAALDEMEMLREEIVNQLETQLKSTNMNGNPFQSDRHIQNSNNDSISDLEPCFEQKQGEIPVEEPEGPVVANEGGAEGYRLSQPRRRPTAGEPRQPAPMGAIKSFPLALVLQACPEIIAYGSGGTISSWRDLMAAAVVVRSMLGVSPDAYQQACETLGPENAATVIACILERAGQINSAGGYLRDLTRRAEKGEFAIGPMLMALARANGNSVRKAG